MKYYAGIGSRSTPQAICNMMTTIAAKLDNLGYILRSGGARGADEAFAKGSVNKQIFIPWDLFNGLALTHGVPDYAYAIAQKYHPGWNYLANGARKMMARNAMQVLGPDLNTPSDFIVCWTPDGCSSSKERTNKSGGTGQAIAHADSLGITVFNLAKKEHYFRLQNFIG